MSKYRIMQVYDLYYIQEFSKEGLIFKTYEWRNLGYYPVMGECPIFFTTYYKTIKEAEAKIKTWLKNDTLREARDSAAHKVVKTYE